MLTFITQSPGGQGCGWLPGVSGSVSAQVWFCKRRGSSHCSATCSAVQMISNLGLAVQDSYSRSRAPPQQGHRVAALLKTERNTGAPVVQCSSELTRQQLCCEGGRAALSGLNTEPGQHSKGCWPSSSTSMSAQVEFLRCEPNSAHTYP
jgi:hypothetical protein